MRVALINPRWGFDGSIYFGCREPHLLLEVGYARALLEARGHEVLLIDAHLLDLSLDDLGRAVADLAAEMTVITTAPTYLFWRCAQPELRVPAETFRALAGVGGLKVAAGPHGSTTPRTALRKLGCDVVVMGECEEALVRLADGEGRDLPGLCYADGAEVRVNLGPVATRFVDAPPLAWPDGWIARHAHHHHRFDSAPAVPGAEVEASRGCPYRCTFCAKENFRDRYRRRALPLLLAEIDRLQAQGVGCQRPGADVPLSRLARLSPALGAAGRRRLGAGTRSLPGDVRPFLRAAERTAGGAVRAGGDVRVMNVLSTLPGPGACSSRPTPSAASGSTRSIWPPGSAAAASRSC